MIKFTDALILFLLVVTTLNAVTLTTKIVGYDLMLACIGVVSVSYAYIGLKLNKDTY